jgi:hypothetical protein
MLGETGHLEIYYGSNLESILINFSELSNKRISLTSKKSMPDELLSAALNK